MLKHDFALEPEAVRLFDGATSLSQLTRHVMFRIV